MQNKTTHIRYNVINNNTNKVHVEVLRNGVEPKRNGFQFIAMQEVSKARVIKNRWEMLDNEQEV